MMFTARLNRTRNSNVIAMRFRKEKENNLSRKEKNNLSQILVKSKFYSQTGQSNTQMLILKMNTKLNRTALLTTFH